MEFQDVIEEKYFTKNSSFPSNPKPKRKLFFKLVSIFLPILIIIILSYLFLIHPYQVSGSPIKPFAYRDIVLTERISYLFKKPQVGDRVIFKPEDYQNDFVGVITKIDNNNTYTVQSSKGSPWNVTKDKIKNKIYYPFISNEEVLKIVSEEEKTFPSPTVTPSQVIFPTMKQLIPTKTLSQITPSAKNTITSTLTPKPTSIRDTTAPQITQMTGPGDGSVIEFNNFCFPIYATDNISKSSGIKVRSRFDSQDWTAWSTDFSQCFQNISSGNHTFSAQVRDEAGNESNIITRTFTVSVPQDISVAIGGHNFSDTNCNGIRDAGESNINNNSTTAYLYRMPEFSIFTSTSTDNLGYYYLSKNIKENESITVQLSLVAPSGYKSNPNFNLPQFTFNKNNKSATIDWPSVPYENIYSCSP